MIHFELRKFLNKKNMTLTELSEKTGISRTSLSQLSNGKSQGIQFDTLENISLALEISPSDLFRMEVAINDFTADFSAVRKIKEYVYSVIMMFKFEVKSKFFWHGVNMTVDFSSDDSKVYTSLKLLSIEETNLFVQQNYKNKAMITDLENETIFIRQAVANTKKLINPPRNEEEYFEKVSAYMMNALPLIVLSKNETKKNKDKILISNTFYSSELKDETINNLQSNDDMLDLTKRYIISYEYNIHLDQFVYKFTDKNSYKIYIDNPLKKYPIDDFTFIQFS